MKRFMAIGIDLLLLIVIVIVVFTMILMKGGNRNMEVVVKLAGLFAFWIYNFLADLFFESVTIGKKIMGVKVVKREVQSSLHFALCHSLLKQLFIHLGWVSIVIMFIMRGEFIYDKWLGIEIENK